MHKTGSYVDRQSETRKPASPFKPSGDIVGKGNFFLRDTQYHLAGFYHDIASVFNVNLITT